MSSMYSAIHMAEQLYRKTRESRLFSPPEYTQTTKERKFEFGAFLLLFCHTLFAALLSAHLLPLLCSSTAASLRYAGTLEI